MTEEEAKTKWCPIIDAEKIGKFNAKCVASACMMWRFKTNRQMGYDRNPDNLCLHAGYCGLGGKP